MKGDGLKQKNPRKPRASTQQVKAAVAHMKENPEESEELVSKLFDVSLTTLISYRHRWARYKQKMEETAEEAQALAPVSVPMLVRSPPPPESAPAAMRAQHLLCEQFETLARIWGPWIKK